MTSVLMRATQSTMGHLLAPVTWEQFLAETWERRPLHVARGVPDYFADLLRVDDIDQILEYGRLVPPRVRIASGGTSVSPDEYVHQDGRLDLHAIRRLYARGESLIFNGLESVWPPIGRLVQAMQRQLSYRVEANAYLTPRGEQAFKPHYDTHEVLVLQLHGTKHWRLYDAAYLSPLPTSSPETSVATDGQVPSMSIQLCSGDLLYVPRGWVHEAASGPVHSSLHLTLGIHPATWYDLLGRVLEIAALRNRELRRSLPVGFLRDDAVPGGLEATLESMLGAVRTDASVAEAIATLHDEFLRRVRHPSEQPAIPTLDKLDDVADDTQLVRVDGAEARLLHFADVAALQFATSIVQGPRHYEAAMRYVLRHEDVFTVADLPGLDKEQRVALARRLLTEGLLQLPDV